VNPVPVTVSIFQSEVSQQDVKIKKMAVGLDQAYNYKGSGTTLSQITAMYLEY
jgi:hypothetical protein